MVERLYDTADDLTKNPAEFTATAQETIDRILEDRVNVADQRPSQVTREAYAAIEADADIITFIVPWDARQRGDIVEVKLDVAKRDAAARPDPPRPCTCGAICAS